MSTYDQELMKETLEKFIRGSCYGFTVEDIITEFKMNEDQSKVNRLINILKNISAQRGIDDLPITDDEKEPFDWLVKFSNCISGGEILQKSKIQKYTSSISTTAEILALPPEVTEIRARVVQAALDGLSESAKDDYFCGACSTVLLPEIIKDDQNKERGFEEIDLSFAAEFNISALSPEEQERLIVRDVIYILSGIPGTFIEPERENHNCWNPIKFKVANGVQESLKDIALEILPLAVHYKCIEKFIKQATFSSCGQVLQALSAELKIILEDYFLFLINLEAEDMYGKLSLIKFLFLIRPSFSIMEILAEITANIYENEFRGCLVLHLLCDKIFPLNADKESQNLIIKLIEKAAMPYMHMLNSWIHKGIIYDPQTEFMVEDNKMICGDMPPVHSSAEYWEKRFTIRRDHVPHFLENLADIIFLTGKYLNVIRQCGKLLEAPQEEVELKFLPIKPNHESVIRDAYLFASKNLLDLLIKEMDLMGYIKSVRRYLLLYQGDFIDQFMDVCEEELSKTVEKVLPMRLENLMGFTLEISLAKYDVYKENLYCELLTYDLVTQITKIINKDEEYCHMPDPIDLYGFECFVFRYEVKGPVSLVLNHISISKYQILFRQLFYCKHVERQLCKIWKENNSTKKFFLESPQLYRIAFILNYRMMNTIQCFLDYMMNEVIEPNWHIFIENIKDVENVDDVLAIHENFLDLSLKNCMLTNATLVKLISKLCNVCLDFCKFIESTQKLFLDAEISSRISEFDDLGISESQKDSSNQTEKLIPPTDTFSKSVQQFDFRFSSQLFEFLKKLTEAAKANPSDSYIDLVHRIDYNSFYSQKKQY